LASPAFPLYFKGFYIPKLNPTCAIIQIRTLPYFEVQRFDREVGELLDKLEKMGELKNTLVVMTGDHGWPFPRGKSNLYDAGARVPLAVMWGDQLKKGRVIDDFVSFVDLAPTFLTAANVKVPADMSGKSLLPILTTVQLRA